VGTEDSGVILVFIYYKCYITVFDKVLCFYFYFGGIFLFIYFKKYHIFYVNYAYFYVVFLITTLKYDSNKFLELKLKDEVTFLSPSVLFWLNSFLWVPIFDPNTRLMSFFFTHLTL